MQSGNKVIIVIPIYKINPTDTDLTSLRRLIKVLPGHTFALVCSESLSVSNYQPYFEASHEDLRIERFGVEFFASIEGYNRLMLSTEFYERFQSWRYLLVHQLDCFMFKDNVYQWVEADLDYIGAPWISTKRQLDFYSSLNFSRFSLLARVKRLIDRNKGKKIFVGNGGFSLRKVEKFKAVARLLQLFFRRHLKGDVNEDLIWSILVTKYFNFKTPTPAVAIKFAIEEIPAAIDLDSLDSLPMACHAWQRYYPDLWKAAVLKFQ